MKERKRVAEEEWLYRRSWLPEKNYLNPDGTAHSRVFKLRASKNETELSVDVKSMTTAEKAVGEKSKFFLFELHNKAVVEIPEPQLTTYHDPLNDATNDAHAVIVGMTIEDDITPGLLARASKRVVI
jgi:hypothetical protein